MRDTVSADRWERIWPIFHAALEREEAERAEFVEEECGSDESLRNEVFELLRSHENAETFLEDRSNLPPASPEAMIGQLVDRYRLRSVIGSGGMGTVYLAEQESPIKRTVALKVIKLGMDTAEVIARFELERQKLAELKHPNIALVFDAGATETGRPYFVMEYIPGVPITDYCDAHNVGIPERVELFIQVCEALQHAHQHGTLHRDIKPSNVLVEVVEARAVPKVIDFGLAKVIDHRSRVATPDTGLGRMIGTPEFMSPEQAMGVSDIDARTDVYSLGMLLYVLLVGSHPLVEELHGMVPEELRRTIREIDTPPPSTRLKRLGESNVGVADHRGTDVKSLYQQIHGDLDRVVMKAIAKDTAHRYSSASEFAADLRRYRTSEPVLAVPPRTRFRHRLIWQTVVFLLTLIAGIGIVREFFSSDKIMLAVLPFENLSGDAEHEYFSDGLTEEMIARLGMIAPEKLGIIARTTSMRYKGSEKTADQIGKELGVDYLLEGSVRYERERLRITAQLIQTDDQTHLWAESYEAKAEDVITTQIEVALRVARSLAVEVLPKKRVKQGSTTVVNPLAYEAYLKGRHFRAMVSEEGFRKGIDHFKQAIDHDPNFVEAYAGMAACYCLLSGHGLEVDQPKFLMPDAKKMAETALALDEELGEAHGALGMAKLKYEWDWEGAKKEFQRAVELNSNDPLTRIWYSFYLSSQGRHDEALSQVKIARDLDPFSRIANVNVAWQYYMARRYAKALEEFHHTLELFPDFWIAHWGRGLTYRCQEGMREEAVADLKLAVERSGGNQSAVGALGLAYAKLGEKEEAQKIVASLITRSEERYVAPTVIAAIYAALGDMDRAFEWLERAYELRSRSLVWLKVGHEFDPLRSEPRYQDLLRRMGLGD